MITVAYLLLLWGGMCLIAGAKSKFGIAVGLAVCALATGWWLVYG